MPTIADIRHANLLLLIGDGHGAVKRFATKIDRDPSQVSQLKTRAKHSKSGEPRDIGDDIARHIEAMLKLTPGWLDTPQSEVPATGDWLPPESGGPVDLAQAMSESHNYSDPPNLQWGALMTADLNRPFELDVIDDALAPEIFRGCKVRLDPNRQPLPNRHADDHDGHSDAESVHANRSRDSDHHRRRIRVVQLHADS